MFDLISETTNPTHTPLLQRLRGIAHPLFPIMGRSSSDDDEEYGTSRDKRHTTPHSTRRRGEEPDDSSEAEKYRRHDRRSTTRTHRHGVSKRQPSTPLLDSLRAAIASAVHLT